MGSTEDKRSLIKLSDQVRDATKKTVVEESFMEARRWESLKHEYDDRNIQSYFLQCFNVYYSFMNGGCWWRGTTEASIC